MNGSARASVRVYWRTPRLSQTGAGAGGHRSVGVACLWFPWQRVQLADTTTATGKPRNVLRKVRKMCEMSDRAQQSDRTDHSDRLGPHV